MPEMKYEPFDPSGGLIFATRLPGSMDDINAHRKRTWEGLVPPAAAPPLWIHLDHAQDRAQQWLREEAGVDPLVAEALLAEETRPRIQPVGPGMLVILRGVNLNPGAEPDELIAVRMWIEQTRVITLRQARLRTVAELREAAHRGEAPDRAGGYLAAVARGLTSRLSDSVLNLEERLDDIEEAMIDTNVDDPGARSGLAVIRRQAISYRRYLVPQRDALLTAANAVTDLLSERDRAELRMAAENVIRVTEALEEVRDRAAVTQDELRARNEARVGRTVYLLTIVASVALPLSLLTGLLGINVGGIPLANSSVGFVAVCGIMVLVAIAEVAFFRHMRWL